MSLGPEEEEDDDDDSDELVYNGFVIQDDHIDEEAQDEEEDGGNNHIVMEPAPLTASTAHGSSVALPSPSAGEPLKRSSSNPIIQRRDLADDPSLNLGTINLFGGGGIVTFEEVKEYSHFCLNEEMNTGMVP